MASASPPPSRPKSLSVASSSTFFRPVSRESVTLAGSAQPQKQNANASLLSWTGNLQDWLRQLRGLCLCVRAAKNRCAIWASLFEALPEAMRSIPMSFVVVCERKKSIPHSRTPLAHDRTAAASRPLFTPWILSQVLPHRVDTHQSIPPPASSSENSRCRMFQALSSGPKANR